MTEYRRNIKVSSESEYWFVSMGPIPGKPDCYQRLYARQSYPFPSLDAATKFAQAHAERDPSRSITIDYPDGRRWDGRSWL